MKKKLCLIDGSGYIFRAFYGLPPLTAPDGTPVNAVYGFTNMFMKLTSKIKCDYSLVLFDAKRQNYRNEIYPEYKANRIETPPDLIPQFKIIREAVDALNLNYLEMEGYEADDLIATFSKKAKHEGIDVTIVSADKDLMQLMQEGVELYDPMKDKFYTDADVKEKFGVTPDRVIDVQALAGDTTDNIPGIPGIGIKTAAELVNQFGSLEAVLENASYIKQNKRRETVLANIDKAELSLKLVTLKDNVPLDTSLEKYSCRKPEFTKLKTFIETHGFKSLLSRVEKWVFEQCSITESLQTEAPSELVKKYSLVQDEASLKQWVDLIQKNRLFAFDTETTGFSPMTDKIVGLSLAVQPGLACYIPIGHTSQKSGDLFAQNNKEVKQLSKETVAKLLGPLFASRSILKIGHNIKFDMHFMAQILGKDAEIFPIDDTSVMSCDLDSSEHGHGLDELAKLYLDYKTIKYEEVAGSGKNQISFAEVGLEKAKDYAAEDADITLRLYDLFKPRLFAEKKTFVYESIDKPLIPILKEMEDNGIKVDTRALVNLSKDFEQKLKEIEKEIYQIAGQEFNLASPKQIGDVLFNKLGLKSKKTAGGGFQTGADVLEKLAEEHELPAKILDWRAFAKLKSTYTDSLVSLVDKQSRVHTTFNQIVVNTGRLASSNPNIQNIPIRSEYGKKIRSCFVAKEGCKLIAVDYSQVELRLMAAIADVKGLKEAFANGIDIHTATASKVFNLPPEKIDSNLRRDAKTINFGIVYGISQYGLARQLNISPEAAKVYIDNYFKELPEIKIYMDEAIAFARTHGYVETRLGRKIFIYGINDKNRRTSSFAERAAINAPIQGFAADVIKLAMNSVLKKLKAGEFKTKMLLQVHDELVFEAPENEVEEVSKLIKECMENATNCEIPLLVEVGAGDNWTLAH